MHLVKLMPRKIILYILKMCQSILGKYVAMLEGRVI